ncbi:MAG: MarR family transcriptional regulator [Burkholderiaceae bacterium]|nr:MarR family transcriptional regulator [Burkholderiaceae bacterium]
MPSRSICTCTKLRQLTRQLSCLYDHHLASEGLTIGQYSYLARIGRFGPMGVIPLANEFGMDRSTMSRGLKPLIAEGWVETVDLPLEMLTDKRSFGVQLTEAGRAKWQSALPKWEEAQQEINRILGDETLHGLIALVDDANHRIERYEQVAR